MWEKCGMSRNETDLKKAIKISGVKNVCSSSVNLEKTEGISKRYIDADFNSYF